MATHSSVLAWRIAETEEPSGLYSPGGRRESDVTARLGPAPRRGVCTGAGGVGAGRWRGELELQTEEGRGGQGGSLRDWAPARHQPRAPPPPYLWAVRSVETWPLTLLREDKAAKIGFSRSSWAAGWMT